MVKKYLIFKIKALRQPKTDGTLMVRLDQIGKPHKPKSAKKVCWEKVAHTPELNAGSAWRAGGACL